MVGVSALARSDWIALQTKAAREYDTLVELERLDVTSVYLPQGFRRRVMRGGGELARLYPRFANIILLPLAELDQKLLRMVPGLRKTKPLTNSDGQLFRIPAERISALMALEMTGWFDHVRLVRRFSEAVCDRVTEVGLAGRQSGALFGNSAPEVGRLIAALSGAGRGQALAAAE
jgi:hypothetical protein